MIYTKGTSDRYVLDTYDRLASILDYTAANGADDFVDIELDINSLYFKCNFNPFNFHDISFTSFRWGPDLGGSQYGIFITARKYTTLFFFRPIPWEH